MDEKLKNLWANNKILFCLALPLILILFFRDVILSLLVGSARKMSQDAQKQDQVLQNQENQQNDAANALKSQADELGKQADENQPPGNDWYKNEH